VTTFEASWTVLNVRPAAQRDSCCNNCNPALLTQLRFQPTLLDDHRLYTYAGDFLFPAMQPSHGPDSRASNTSRSDRSVVSLSAFLPLHGNFVITKESQQSLRTALDEWSKQRHERRGGGKFLSRHVAMPPKRVEKIVSSAAGFLRVREVTTDTLLKTVKLDLLSRTEVQEVAQVISEWQDEATVSATPGRKKSRPALLPSTPIPQPAFAAPSSKSVDTSMPSHPRGKISRPPVYRIY
jgi:hypothetical protein